MVFPLIVLSSNLEQLLNKSIEIAIRDPNGVQSNIIFYGAASILWSTMFPIFMTACVLFFLCSETGFQGTPQQFFKKYLNQLYIEIMRSWGCALQYGLLLILPGIWKFIKLLYVPYAVVSSREYDAGKTDALKMSESVFSRYRGKTILVFSVGYILIPLFMAALFDGYRSLFQTPLQSLLLNAFDTYVLIFVNFILFTLFKNEVRNSESHV